MRILVFVGLALSMSTMVLPADRYASPPKAVRAKICPGAPQPKPFEEVEQQFKDRLVMFYAANIHEQVRSLPFVYAEICDKIESRPVFAYDPKLQEEKAKIENWCVSSLGMDDSSVEQLLLQPSAHKRQRRTHAPRGFRSVL